MQVPVEEEREIVHARMVKLIRSHMKINGTDALLTALKKYGYFYTENTFKQKLKKGRGSSFVGDIILTKAILEITNNSFDWLFNREEKGSDTLLGLHAKVDELATSIAELQKTQSAVLSRRANFVSRNSLDYLFDYFSRLIICIGKNFSSTLYHFFPPFSTLEVDYSHYAQGIVFDLYQKFNPDTVSRRKAKDALCSRLWTGATFERLTDHTRQYYYLLFLGYYLASATSYIFRIASPVILFKEGTEIDSREIPRRAIVKPFQSIRDNLHYLFSCLCEANIAPALKTEKDTKIAKEYIEQIIYILYSVFIDPANFAHYRIDVKTGPIPPLKQYSFKQIVAESRKFARALTVPVRNALQEITELTQLICQDFTAAE